MADTESYSNRPEGAEPSTAHETQFSPKPVASATPTGSSSSSSSSSQLYPDEDFAKTASPSAVASPKPTTTAAATLAASLPTVPLPPVVAALVKKIEEGYNHSSFPIVRSRVGALFSWKNPLLTGCFLLTVVTVYMAHIALAFSFASIALQGLLLLLLGAAVVKARNHYIREGAPWPTLALPVDAHSIDQSASSIGNLVSQSVTAVNSWLSWDNPAASVHALAYIWLATRFSGFLSAGWTFLGLMSLFVLLPAYLINQAQADAAVVTLVRPKVAAAATQLQALTNTVKAQVGANSFAFSVLAGLGTLGLLYVTYGNIRIATWVTMASLTVTAVDLIMRAATSLPASVSTSSKRE